MFLGRAAFLFWVGALALAGSQFAEARPPRQSLPSEGEVPNCPAYDLKSKNGGNPGSLEINNDKIIEWKREGRNQRHERGRAYGVIAQVYPDRNGHEHFSIRISAQGKGGEQIEDTVEIIYNHSFGEMPAPRVGMEVEACGDYITSNAPSGGPGGRTYPASPDGAIIHWVHIAPDRSGHHSGYVVIDGVVVGQDLSKVKPRGRDQDRGGRDKRRPKVQAEALAF
jgi:hypothetical protein